MSAAELTFGNPAGAWALLGLVVVAAIHLLQRQSRRVTVTTRFLLETLQPVSAHGRRIERIRNSLPLWLQLLIVLIATWILLQPRWLAPDTRQTVVVVLDSSLSMDAFREEIARRLSVELPLLAGAARATNWVVIESDPARPRLYAGPSLDGAMNAVEEWRPRLGSHDIEPVLRLANALAGRGGSVVFVSDREIALPSGIQWLGVGAPIPNVGWLGARVDDVGWTALVRNHDSSPATRTWAVRDADDQIGPQTSVTLQGGETRKLSGLFPDQTDRVTLELSPDRFDADDQLPIVRPAAKELGVAVRSGDRLGPFLERLRSSLADAIAVDENPDLQLVEFDVSAALEIPSASMVFAADPEPRSKLLPGVVVAEDHPLVTNLSWQGLLVRDSQLVRALDGDDVLLWHGDRPLIFLRGRGSDQSLVINFDVSQSNADRIPAFIVLLNRFVDRVRAEKVGFMRANFDVNQPLDVATTPDGSPPVIEGRDDGMLRAPERAGFFTVTEDGVARLEGSAQFADPREAEFHQAASGGSLAATASDLLEQNSRPSSLTPAFLLVLFGVVLGSWWAVERRKVAL